MSAASKIFDFLETATAVAVGVLFLGCLVGDPLIRFWQRHTCREENGLLVRDYEPLRQWAQNILEKLAIAALVIGLICLLYWVMPP